MYTDILFRYSFYRRFFEIRYRQITLMVDVYLLLDYLELNRMYSRSKHHVHTVHLE